MGYANLGQKGHGIHLRQFARAFVLEQDGTRIVYVSIDAAMMGIGVRREVKRPLYFSLLYFFPASLDESVPFFAN